MATVAELVSVAAGLLDELGHEDRNVPIDDDLRRSCRMGSRLIMVPECSDDLISPEVACACSRWSGAWVSATGGFRGFRCNECQEPVLIEETADGMPRIRREPASPDCTG